MGLLYVQCMVDTTLPLASTRLHIHVQISMANMESTLVDQSRLSLDPKVTTESAAMTTFSYWGMRFSLGGPRNQDGSNPGQKTSNAKSGIASMSRGNWYHI